MPESAALPAPGNAQTVLLDGGAGRIECLVAVPAQPAAPPGCCVVCHPHPLHGGALTNKVAYTLAASALQCGLAVARFNFRGVGRSEGTHDEGRGETDDTLAVARWLQAQCAPGARLVLAGFSFGAFVALKAATRLPTALTVSIAPPFRHFGAEAAPARPAGPWLVVHGRDDEVVPFDHTRQALARYAPPPELVEMDGVGHFFHGRLGDLQHAVTGFIRREWARVT
ncbi:MAG TPA: alpha/beta fold hydrolase [Candidatus Binatia bacterium]|nr:alpha/beta fold hydrolase [Candidatus Binatia bacterium]